MRKQINLKKAKEMAKEIVRCENIIEEFEDQDCIEVKQAKSKISMIARAYQSNPEMMFAIIVETEKLM